MQIHMPVCQFIINMGKKIKIVASDPILSNNFKYQKRSKTKLLEKLKSEEERALQLKKKKELLEVEKKVDRQIDSMTTNLATLQKHRHINQFKNKIFHKNSQESAKQGKFVPSNIPEIGFNNQSPIQDCYDNHFKLTANPELLVKEKKTTIRQKIEEQTKQQIKSMFGTSNIPSKQNEMEEEEEADGAQVYNLQPQSKRQHEVKIKQQVYYVSQQFEGHKQILSEGKDQHNGDHALNNAQTFINGYFDHLFIENSQEQKIQMFRKIVIQHCLGHIQRSVTQQKGRGFTNCKVLILTPFFGDAKAIFDIIEQHFTDFEVLNKEKLDEVDDENDFFRVGVKIARKKKNLSYFSNFDHSEFIIASPVGLKSIIGSEGDAKRQNSFISSVEILYIDRASVLLMQNWAHLTEILKNMNNMPKYESLKNSIDSIRQTFLELKGRIYRQNIVFSEFNFPQLNALKPSHFHNLQGSITSKPFYSKPTLQANFQQNFYKIQLKSSKQDLQARFEYFKRKFWDDLHNKQSMTKIILFTNSYFEYVKLKSFLQKVNASAQYICEHTSANKVQSRLAKFNNDQFRILLMTERAYYFQVCKAKKFHHVYFYSLPKNSFVFEELMESVQKNESQDNTIVSIYTKYDILILQRIVGTVKATEMVRQYCNNVSFIL